MFVDVSTLRALSHRLAMGDYPRWVNRADVDSQAMFSAYMQYRAANALSDDATETEWQPEWWGHLHMIHHRVSHVHKNILRPETGGVKGRECTQGACSRCEGGVGGYQFRWYSPFLGEVLQQAEERRTMDGARARARQGEPEARVSLFGSGASECARHPERSA